jgi:hypothetical protein
MNIGQTLHDAAFSEAKVASHTIESTSAGQKGGGWQDRGALPRVHLSQMRVAGDHHLGIHSQSQGKKFIVFWVAVLAYKPENFNHTHVLKQSIDKRLPHLRAGIPIKL